MRIAITNDNVDAIDELKSIILSVPGYEVAWIADNGMQAVNMAKLDTPDLILMDIYMPVMDGVEATREIMLQAPCAILIVTSSIHGHSGKVFDAMGVGAMDAVNTPVLTASTDTHDADVVRQKIATLKILIHPPNNSGFESGIEFDKSNNQKIQSATHFKNNIVVIGASTGGPAALVTVLKEFPADFPVAIVVVQHIDAQFVHGLTNWLNKQISLSIKLSEEGDSLKAGTVYLAGSDKHLLINESGILHYQDEPVHYAHKPSVNVLFESIALNWKGHAVGVLLTGMGKDGARGLLSMRKQGFYTITQNQESCAVYGMPKTAVELGAAQLVLPLNEIGSEICHYYEFNKNSPGVINE